MLQFCHRKNFYWHHHNVFNLDVITVEALSCRPTMATTFSHVIGFDPNGIRRIYASTWIGARQHARTYIRKRPDTAPLSGWRFELLPNISAGMMSAASKLPDVLTS